MVIYIFRVNLQYAFYVNLQHNLHLFILTITYGNIIESADALLIPLEMVHCYVVQQVAALSSERIT